MKFPPTISSRFQLLATTSVFPAIIFVLGSTGSARQNPSLPSLQQETRDGLMATYTSGEATVARFDQDILFCGDSNQRDSRLPAQDFVAKWTGSLNVSEPARYRFHFYGVGSFQLKLQGRVVLTSETVEPGWKASDELQLERGPASIQVVYSSLNGQASVGLYWSSNLFQLEPIEGRYFSCMLDSAVDQSPEELDYGRALFRALRCQACHSSELTHQALQAPSLKRIAGNIEPAWLHSYLQSSKPLPDKSQQVNSASSLYTRRMPHFGLSDDQAKAITAALWQACELQADPGENLLGQWTSTQLQLAKKRKSKDPPVRTSGDPSVGEQTFVSQGCIACHSLGDLGNNPSEQMGRTSSVHTTATQELFSGGDLALLTGKRPVRAIAAWLEDPSLVNPNHRMPSFDLSAQQKLDLLAWLISHDAPRDPNHKSLAETAEQSSVVKANDDQIERGRDLISKFGCGKCHELPASLQQPTQELDAASQVQILGLTKLQLQSSGCIGGEDSESHPSFNLNQVQKSSMATYLSSTRVFGHALDPQQLLLENNCLSCHRRGAQQGISRHFITLSEEFPDLARLLPGMTPPALDAVGDKLHRPSIEKALGSQPDRLRDWLDIRMPQFNLATDKIALITDYFISHDRIPPVSEGRVTSQNEQESTAENAQELQQSYWLAAGRLVTPEGFSCQSCHQIADYKPTGIALNTHGTDLTMLGNRIREPWFYRWVKNPARLVPRMEMPAIQTPVHGLLGDSLDRQLQALWRTLNRPDFRPPKPNPVRTIRNHFDGQNDPTRVLTDVIEMPEVVIRPIVIGLPNRHNWLIDLAHGGLRSWWLGDVARQHTRGKSWYWETGSQPLISSEFLEAWRVLTPSGQVLAPQARSGRQFAVDLDQLQHLSDGILWHGRVHFGQSDSKSSASLSISQRWRWIGERDCQIQTELSGLEPGWSFRLITSGAWMQVDTDKSMDQGGPAVSSGDANAQGDQIRRVRATFAGDHYLEYAFAASRSSIEANQLTLQPQSSNNSGSISWLTKAVSSVPADTFPRPISRPAERQPKLLDCVPGFEALQLPVPANEMPISFAWDSASRLFMGSLKGRVLQVSDLDGDGLEENYQLISDEIPTPYGIHAHEQGIDVLAKFGLLRLTEPGSIGPVRDFEVIADGWGYTQDYHDWAVGLEKDAAGSYYITLPCQQDERSDAAAHLRGHALKLIPIVDFQDARTSEAKRRYRVESLAAGLRFPMGIAMNSQEELFTSDNQGNYTPFNEINHIRPGKRYGFINKLENKDGFSPPFESPAVNIPHPWMRSVNGICFLEDPHRKPTSESMYGPFEGHLLGCEMNGRCLVRISLQSVAGQYQGAVYPFSLPMGASETNFEGPIVIEKSPSGDLYVGNLHDSGWGGGNNTGSIVRLRPLGQFPMGIAQVQAIASGFEVQFTQAVDPKLAVEAENYSLRSYVRTPTPAYGGEDQDQQIEQIVAIELDPSGKSVRLKLAALRPGAVYELNVLPIGDKGQPLFPSQAHYTMRAIPN